MAGCAPDARRDGEAVVEATGLTKLFGDFCAVDNLSFTVRAGEVFGLLGPNGAGKSTTIRMLCGLLPPSAGSARVGGFDVARAPRRARSVIGYMSQKFSLYEDLTAAENLNLFGGLYGLSGGALAERKSWALRMARLEGRENDLAGSLATGFRQRLALGCAALHRPRILFLDEPTSGVDPLTRRAFWDLIYSFAREGVAAVVTTHFMDEAECCFRLAMIMRGRIAAIGSPREIKSERLAGKVLRVAGPGVVERLDSLRRLPGARAAHLFGATARLATDDPAGLERRVRQLFGDGGDKIAMSIVAPALEDVFAALMGAGGPPRPAAESGTGEQENNG